MFAARIGIDPKEQARQLLEIETKMAK